MKLTRLGKIYLFFLILTFYAALGSGNNLLYLAYSMLLAAVAAAALLQAANLARLKVEFRFPDQIFAQSDFRVRLEIRNPLPYPRYQLRLSGGNREAFIARIGAGGCAEAVFRQRVERRGKIRLRNFYLESGFPWGIFRRRLSLSAETLVLPQINDAPDMQLVKKSSQAGVLRPVRGVGEELYAIREYNEGDDTRLINWKITARTGKIIVNEYAQPFGGQIALDLRGIGAGPAAERQITSAAAACKFLLDGGVEVRLMTDDAETEFGRGPLHLEKILHILALTGEGNTLRDAAPAPPAPRDDRFENTPRLHRFGYVLAAVSYGGLLLAEEFTWPLFTAGAMLMALGVVLDLRRRWLKTWPSNAFSAAMLAYLIFYAYPHRGLTAANLELAVYILLNRMLSPKGDTECKQILLASFFLFFQVSGTSISPWYLSFALLFFLAAGAWLWESQNAAPAPVRQWVPASAMLILLCLPAAVSVFLATPRVERRRGVLSLGNLPLPAIPYTLDSKIGFTDTVSLGFFGRKNSNRALKIEMPSAKNPSGKELYGLRLRGNAFDYFDGQKWFKSPIRFSYRYFGKTYRVEGSKAWLPRDRSRTLFPGFRQDQKLVPLDFTVYPVNSSVLFTLGRPAVLVGNDPGVYFDFTDTVFFTGAYDQARSYRLYAQPDETGFKGHILDYAQLLHYYLQLPKQDKAVEKLAERITARAAGPRQEAEMIADYLRENYEYSLLSQEGDKSLKDFLFDSRTGNCEYFASAAVVLMRMRKIPARLATGFVLADWNPYGRFYDVRQHDAHAWTEAYLPESGWTPFDPTPPGSSQGALIGSYWKKLRQYFTALEVNWYRRVVGYDRNDQNSNWQKLFQSWKNLLKEGLKVLILAAALVALGWAGRRALTLAEQKRRTRGQDAFYLDLLRLLEKRGHAKKTWQTGREFAREVVALNPRLAAVADLTEQYYQCRYRGRPIGEKDERRIKDLLRRLKTDQ